MYSFCLAAITYIVLDDCIRLSMLFYRYLGPVSFIEFAFLGLKLVEDRLQITFLRVLDKIKHKLKVRLCIFF